MAATLIDSNVLLDLMTEDQAWFSWSSAAIRNTAESARLVINAIIYAEVSVRFSRMDALDAILSPDIFEREDIPFEAGFLAGKAHLAYRQRGGARQSPLPDFIIGAHASVAGYRLLTRDEARYRAYFPRLALITP